MELVQLLLALFAGSAGSILLASGLLLLNDRKLITVSNCLVSYAGGTMLAAAFLGMLPRALEAPIGNRVFLVVLGGIILFFILEKIILWRTCPDQNCERKKNAAAPLVIVGDALHNFIDGIVIAAAFLTSPAFGWMVALSVIAHEVPQELGDFGVLISQGLGRTRAIFWNMVSGLTTFAGGLLAWFLLRGAQNLIPYVLALSASSFIYIALADLIPQMHKKSRPGQSVSQLMLILAGISTIIIIIYHKHA